MTEASNIGLAAAFAAGIVSFLSPRALPLVPGYISYIAGQAVDSQIRARSWHSASTKGRLAIGTNHGPNERGKTGELVWQFTRVGTFDFARLQLGHFDAGMHGKVAVNLLVGRARARNVGSWGTVRGEFDEV